jgi:hypothetical protein
MLQDYVEKRSEDLVVVVKLRKSVKSSRDEHELVI